MNIEKNIDDTGAYILIRNQFNDILKIYYEDDSLYFMVENHKDDNCFYITTKNDLYEPLKELFLNLRRNDTLHFKSLGRIGNRFEWIGEGKGIPEMQDRLVIEQRFDLFKIHLVKNKFNSSKKNSKVGFSLNNSNFPEIAKSFDDMFVNSFRESSLVKKKTMTVKWI